MILAVVKTLVAQHTKDELDAAATAFETDRSNTLNVEGKDDGEILSNLLVASFVRSRVDKGMPVQDAIREYSSRVRGMISPNKK
jgi:hypothetical protein